MEELLLAAEYILNGGNSQVMLCERGIRTFETHTRFTLPLASVPYLQAKRICRLWLIRAMAPGTRIWSPRCQRRVWLPVRMVDP